MAKVSFTNDTINCDWKADKTINSQGVMIICSKFDCSKNLLNTILLLLNTVRAIIFFLVNCSTAVGNLLSCRINWIWAINYFSVNCSNCRPIYIWTVVTVKTDTIFCSNFACSTEINFPEHVRQEYSLPKWNKIRAVYCQAV